jgi:argininosuccinate lyase
MVADAGFHPPLPASWVTALDLAEALVRRGVPFREAHHAVGRLVSTLVSAERDLESVTPADLEAADARFEPEDAALVDVSSSVDARASLGGGSVESVHRQIEALRYAFTQGA